MYAYDIAFSVYTLQTKHATRNPVPTKRYNRFNAKNMRTFTTKKYNIEYDHMTS